LAADTVSREFARMPRTKILNAHEHLMSSVFVVIHEKSPEESCGLKAFSLPGRDENRGSEESVKSEGRRVLAASGSRDPDFTDTLRTRAVYHGRRRSKNQKQRFYWDF
jgi:hypothetical protein